MRTSIRARSGWIVAVLAIAIAVSGSAVAAQRYLITSTKQISPKVLKTLQGKRGARGAAGPAGAAGAAGSNGTNGLNGLKGDTGASGVNGTNGTNGTNGAAGARGPSDVVYANAPAVTNFPGDASYVAVPGAALALDPGSWLVTAKLVADHTAAGNAALDCELSSNGGITALDQSIVGMGASADGARYATMTLQVVTAGSVALYCLDNNAAVAGSNIRMTAIKVATATDQS